MSLDPSVIDTAIVSGTGIVLGWLAKTSFFKKLERSSLNEDIAKSWPTIKTALPAAAQFAGIGDRVSKVEGDLAKVNAELDKKTGGLTDELESSIKTEVETQFKTLFPALFADIDKPALPAAAAAASTSSPGTVAAQ